MKTALVIILLFMLSGCSLFQTKCDPIIKEQIVKVPVVVVPKPPVTTRPTLNAGKVPIDPSDYGLFVKQLEVDMEALKQHTIELEQIIKEYDEMPHEIVP